MAVNDSHLIISRQTENQKAAQGGALMCLLFSLPEGFAEQGFRQASIWLGATMAAIEACECPAGCPSCVQSPKCGNGNDPLDKAGAVRVLRLVLTALAEQTQTYG